jgi:hypothetical protein
MAGFVTTINPGAYNDVKSLMRERRSRANLLQLAVVAPGSFGPTALQLMPA